MRKNEVIITVNSLAFGGQGRGATEDGREILAWNAYPGETVRVRLSDRSVRSIPEGIAVEVIDPSPDRITPEEPHFLASSPWQSISYEKEKEYKQDIVQRIWKEEADITTGEIPFTDDGRMFEYRNAMEYNITRNEHGTLELALMKRGRQECIPVKESKLAHPVVNNAAHSLLAWIEEVGLTEEDIRQVHVRVNQNSDTVAAIYLNGQERSMRYRSKVLPEGLQGLVIHVIDPTRTRLIIQDTIAEIGNTTLSEQILGIPLSYGPTSFFQANIPVFEKAVRAISKYVSGEHILDYYSGVGAIGIPLADLVAKAVLIESNSEAIHWAKYNIGRNNLQNYRTIKSRSEDEISVMEPHQTVIVDPPRSGLDVMMIKALLNRRPQKIIYLSCKPFSQASNIKRLFEAYDMVHIGLFNFFPRTPHIESLCILERKN